MHCLSHCNMIAKKSRETASDATSQQQQHAQKLESCCCCYCNGDHPQELETYLDLMRVVVEHFVYSTNSNAVMEQSTASSSHSDDTAAAPTATTNRGTLPLYAPFGGGALKPSFPVSAVKHGDQVAVLLAAVIPRRVEPYFAAVRLTTPIQHPCCTGLPEYTRKSTDGLNGTCTVPEERPLKRQRGHQHQCSEEKTKEGNGKVGSASISSVLDRDGVVPLDPTIGPPEAEMSSRLAHYLIECGARYLPPLDDDTAYLTARDVQLLLRHHCDQLCGFIVGNITFHCLSEKRIDYVRQCLPCIRLLSTIVTGHVSARLQAMPTPPRIHRLAHRLRLSPAELRTLEYLLLCHSGRYLVAHLPDPLRPASIAHQNRLTPSELLCISTDGGVLWKQGLIFSNGKLCTSYMDSKYGMPVEVIAALSGDAVSDEQLIKLERTVLSEVLVEERRRTASTSKASTPPHHREDGDGSRRPSVKRGRTEKPSRNGSDAEEEEDGDEETEEGQDDMLSASDGATEQPSSELVEGGEADSGVEGATQQHADAPHDSGDGKREGTPSAVDSPPVRPQHPASTSVLDAEEEEGSSAQPKTAPKRRLTLADVNPLSPSSRVILGGVDPQRPAANCDVPYESDIEYMDEAFRILANLIRIRYAEGDIKDDEDNYVPKSKLEASIRELKGKVRIAASFHESRLRATIAAKKFVPRIEQLAQKLKLTEMEKQVMMFMVGNVVSHDILVAVNGRFVMREGSRMITVGYMLFVLCGTLEERVVARRAFYQSSPLISNGILTLTLDSAGRTCFNADLMDYTVDIDRKIIDDVMGITAETSEMVPGSQLYYPAVELENVALPSDTMTRVLSTIQHYSLFERCKRRSGFGDGLSGSKGGLVMLFYGPSGTGKTMLANAVAHSLRKRILLVSISQFKAGGKESDALRFLFREAKLNDAIIFFDECELLFEDRSTNPTVTALLAEFERYEGLIIMATNKAQNMDEAMNRRISLMIEFRPPDHQLRLQIWASHVPKHLPLAADVHLEKLALNYELCGGLIRNAVLAALNQAVGREQTDKPTITMADLEEGARLQLRGFFLAGQQKEGLTQLYITPKRTLAELVVDSALMKQLVGIANVAKSRNTLFAQWGFSDDAYDDCGGGALYLFHGVSGTGKSLAAEGIAYECGSKIRLCNIPELLLRKELDVHTVFEEGRRLGAMIVFDEAQVLFNESDQSLQTSQLIQYHARRYPRPVIIIATTVSRDGMGSRQLFSTTNINPRSSCMTFLGDLVFRLPDQPLRQRIWASCFPSRVPLASDVDFAELSRSELLSPKLIRVTVFHVCCAAALLQETQRVVTMAMIKKEIERTKRRERSSMPTSAMFA